MSDEVLNIKVTATEIDLIMDALHAFEPDGSGWDGQDLHELADDLREQLHRRNDEWSNPEDPDLFMDPVDFSAKHDIEPGQIVICDAEINAGTATSRAAGRRTLNFAGRADSDRSEMQDVDVWDANDPRNW